MRTTTLFALASIPLLAVPACHHSSQPAASPEPARRTTRATTRTTTVAAPVKASPEVIAEELIARTNSERRGAGVPALTRSANLMRAAEIQAEQMARANVMEHDIPGAAYPSLGSRLAHVNYIMRAAGENIGEGYRSPSAAVAGWMASAGHRANILSPNFTEIGVGMAPGPNGSVYWVQVFGRPR